jgi:phosphoglycolate phosphatase-like HAD superfamily hydrolase
VVVVGDTPHDVACARAHGCRCLAVATGTYSREKLAGCEPDLLLDDLTETDAILDWIVQMDPVP